jgi:UDPglucose--hexose-1-phosphate uridylyltransferase
LTGEWVVVSPQRTQRPWNGQRKGSVGAAPAYGPQCYLCPGNERAGGARNPAYETTYVFQNDFASLLPEAPPPPRTDDELFRIDSGNGDCRVICFSPRHDVTLANMAHVDVLGVIALWQAQLEELCGRYRWVQIFETRGAISGASNPHPHGQIWASDFLPDEAVKELATQRRYRATHGRELLVDYVVRELEMADRVVVANESWVVVVPYWAYWPYETMVLPRRPVSSLIELDATEYEALAPLLRSADVAKIPASYELLANLQRDLTPEAAAGHLRDRVRSLSTTT